MKILTILTILTASAIAQKQYPQCIVTDCVNFLEIGFTCGYDGTSSSSLTDAQKMCICNASGILTAYQQCAVCMALDPQNTVTYATWPTACALNTLSSSKSSLKSVSLATSSRSTAPYAETMTETVASSSVVVVVKTSTSTVTTRSSGQSTSRTSVGQTASGSIGVASVSQTGTSTPTSGSTQSGTSSAPSAPVASLLLGMGDCGKSDCGPGTGNASTYGNSQGSFSSDGVRGVVVYGCYVLGGLMVVGLGWL